MVMARLSAKESLVITVMVRSVLAEVELQTVCTPGINVFQWWADPGFEGLSAHGSIQSSNLA
jgi:hypothetical protein